MVSGWRVNRKDNALIRNFPSKIANWLISRVGGVKLHDYGCSLLKAYDGAMLKKIRLYAEMHRFIPLYMVDMGARYAELPVNHAASGFRCIQIWSRKRIFKVLFDLVVVHYFIKYKSKPSYFLGSFSLIAFLSIAFATWAFLGLKILVGVSFVDTPLLMLSGLAFLICLIFIALIIQLDMMMRIYFGVSLNNHPLTALERTSAEMCGIAGVVGFVSEKQTGDCIENLSKRGPDASGSLNFEEQLLTLIHTRLSILDLDYGQQPMKTKDERYAITFNGEIYNHKEIRTFLISKGAEFQTHNSDTEVILEAFRYWGTKSFVKLTVCLRLVYSIEKMERSI